MFDIRKGIQFIQLCTKNHIFQGCKRETWKMTVKTMSIHACMLACLSLATLYMSWSNMLYSRIIITRYLLSNVYMCCLCCSNEWEWCWLWGRWWRLWWWWWWWCGSHRLRWCKCLVLDADNSQLVAVTFAFCSLFCTC